MIKILKYSFFDLIRSRWLLIYFLFFLVITTVLFQFSADPGKNIVSLLNVEIAIVPMVGILFGMMYFYNSSEFTVLLLAQPLRRRTIMLGMYFGLAIPLSLCFLAGSAIPLLWTSTEGLDPAAWLLYLITGLLLTFIFTACGFLIALLNDNRIRGFGLSVLLWLYLVILYDGIFLYILMAFQDYPLDTPALVLTLLNPVDLARVIVLLKLDISALLGYSGARFSDFFGNFRGIVIAMGTLLLYVLLPLLLLVRIAGRKHF